MDEFNKNWNREKINENIFLYKNGINENKKLIIAFCGNMMRLMMPTYIFLGYIERNSCDILLLRDPTRQHYVNGVTEIATSIDSLSDWIINFQENRGYVNKIFFGTSSGGLISLALGLKNNNMAIAICPESPMIKLAYKDYFIKMNEDAQNKATLKVFLGKGYDRDVKAAGELMDILPQVQITADEKCNVHYYLFDLFLRYKLKNFISHEVLAL